MRSDSDTVSRPWWVRLAVWGVPNRPSAWVFVWVFTALAVGFVVFGFVEPWFAGGALFIVGAMWELLAIQWMDRHHAW